MKCSFCGKTKEETAYLIAGQGVYICEECITTCEEIISDERQKSALAEKIKESQEQIARMRIALIKLAKLGNGNAYGNSEGNIIAIAALAN
jgi:ATP-dependent protease Clp ATPase subunit